MKQNYEEKRSDFSERIIALMKQIPKGKVATYGQIANMAGNPRGARQVAWLLHSSTRKENLPWHRVVNSRRTISLPKGGGYEEQEIRLRDEGVNIDSHGKIDFKLYLWNPLEENSLEK